MQFKFDKKISNTSCLYCIGKIHKYCEKSFTNRTQYFDPLIEKVGEVQTLVRIKSKGNFDIEFDNGKGNLVLLPKGHELQNGMELLPFMRRYLFEIRCDKVLLAG